jgi:hypothetical protein
MKGNKNHYNTMAQLAGWVAITMLTLSLLALIMDGIKQ